MLRDFVLEPDVFIYFVTMRGLQFIGFDQQNNGSIIEAQIMSLDAFGDTVIIISDSDPTFSKVCNVTAGLCQSTISVYMGMQPITDILTFRKSKQPLPGMVFMYRYMYMYMLYIYFELCPYTCACLQYNVMVPSEFEVCMTLCTCIMFSRRKS